MSGALYPALPAERVQFRERFRDPATVVRNGGTLVGSPVIKNGATFDGTTDYLSYVISSFVLASAQITFVVEFTPHFTPADTEYRVLVDTNSNWYRIYKDTNGDLTIKFNNVEVGDYASGAYGSYWKTNERNIIVISGETGSTKTWLNGNLLGTDASAWTPGPSSPLYVGAFFNATGHFDGTIYSVSIHRGLWDQQDVDALQDGSLFRYRNRTSLWLDMAEAIIDGSSDHTLDKSRNGSTVLLGDGAGTGTPTWESPGFTFDGVNDYLILSADPTGTFTVAWKRRGEVVNFESDLTTWNLIKASGSFTGLLDYLAWWPFTLSSIQQRDLEQAWAGGR